MRRSSENVTSGSISLGNAVPLESAKNILLTFYHSFIESISTFSIMCWFHSVSLRLESMTKVCSKIIGLPTRPLSTICEQQTLRLANRIIQDHSHALHSAFDWLPSGRWLHCAPWVQIKSFWIWMKIWQRSQSRWMEYFGNPPYIWWNTFFDLVTINITFSSSAAQIKKLNEPHMKPRSVVCPWQSGMIWCVFGSGKVKCTRKYLCSA